MLSQNFQDFILKAASACPTMGNSVLQDETITFSRNVGNKLLRDAASYARIKDTSAAQLQKNLKIRIPYTFRVPASYVELICTEWKLKETNLAWCKQKYQMGFLKFRSLIHLRAVFIYADVNRTLAYVLKSKGCIILVNRTANCVAADSGDI